MEPQMDDSPLRPAPPAVRRLDDEPHFTVHDMLAALCSAQGVTPAAFAVDETVVATFIPGIWKRLLALAAATPRDRWLVANEVATVAHGTRNGRPLTLVRLPQGAPAMAMVVEGLIATGARRIIALGAAGSLQEHAPIGSLVIPTAAVRGDGTSGYYLPPDRDALVDPELCDALVAGCRAHGVEPLLGACWSTDALFRELKGEVAYYRARGVLSVEMEAAALFSIAAFHGVQAALLLVISDELFRPWTPAFGNALYRERFRLAQEIALDAAALLPTGGSAP
jgi:uridine phosphorylase